MAKCKNCGDEIDWAMCDERWVPLEPVTATAAHGMTLRYTDPQGVLRADHRERCSGVMQVRKLKHPIRQGHYDQEVQT